MAAMQVTKTCPTCKIEHPLNGFYVDRSRPDCRGVYCKRCKNSRTKKNYRHIMQDPVRAAVRRKQCRLAGIRRYNKNPERVRALNRAKYARHPEKVGAQSRASRARYPERERARSKLNYAIRTGKLVKPKTCSQCNRTTSSRRLHGHHGNYTKPLEVIWMCSVCHGDQHPSSASCSESTRGVSRAPC